MDWMDIYWMIAGIILPVGALAIYRLGLSDGARIKEERPLAISSKKPRKERKERENEAVKELKSKADLLAAFNGDLGEMNE